MKLEDFLKDVEKNCRNPKTAAELAELPGAFLRLAMNWASSEAGGYMVNGHQVTPSKEEVKAAKEEMTETSEMLKKLKIWKMITQLSDIILEDPKKNIPALFHEATEEKYKFSYKSAHSEVGGDAVANLSIFAFGETAKKSAAAFPIVLDLIGPDEKLSQIAQWALSSIFMNTPKEKRTSLSIYLPQLEKKLGDPVVSPSVKEPLGDMAGMLKGAK